MSERRINRIGPGYRTGRLTVTDDSGERKNGYIVWNCLCDCGNTIRVDKRTLERGTVTDCGCVTKIRPGQRDITGQKFGMLTAQYSTGRKDKRGAYYWHCTCDCGGSIDVSVHQLQAGYRKSCGCLSHPPLKDFTGKRFGKLTVSAYAGRTKSCGCVRADVMRENLKLINGTSVTLLQRNRKNLNRLNTSGFTGVYQNKKSGKWIAEIVFQGKMYYLGCYEKKDDAVKARQRGEEMYLDFLDWYYGEQRNKKDAADR